MAHNFLFNDLVKNSKNAPLSTRPPKMLTRALDKGRASGLSQSIPQRLKMMGAGATESASRSGLARSGE
jgi:hypothetical protein